MLRTSTKNVAYEVISCLIETNGRGVLTEIIKWLTTCNQNLLNDSESILNQLSSKKTEAHMYDSDQGSESYLHHQPTMTNFKQDSPYQASLPSSSGSGIPLQEPTSAQKQ